AANLAAPLGEQNGGGGGAAAGAPGAATASAQAAGDGAGPAAAGAEPQAAGAEAGSGTTAAAETPVNDLKLPARAVSSLRRENLTTAGHLAAKTEDELLAIDGIGPASVVDIKASLADLGLELRSAGPEVQAPSAVPAPAAPTAATPHTSTARETAHRLEEDAINLLKVAGMPVLKRAIPVVAALAAALVVGLRRRVRRRRG